MAAEKDTKPTPKPRKAPVVKLTTGSKVRPEVDSSREAGKKWRSPNFLLLSFILCVILPICAGVFFWAQMASDRYVSGAGFAVRSMDEGGGTDFLGGLTGMAGTGSTSSDSYIVMEFINGRSMVERIEEEKSFSEMFSGAEIDPLFRLKGDAGMEDRLEYWSKRIKTSFDSSSGIVAFDVEAFSPEDSLFLSKVVLKEAGLMVNRLSEVARKGALTSANGEVHRAEARLGEAMMELRKFRSLYGDIDPTATAAARLEIDTSLESDLINLRSRISILEKQVKSDSPPLLELYRKEAALLEAMGGSADKKSITSSQIEEYETLQIEREFAQKAYMTALSSLEAARAKADGQQRYLAIFSDPAQPDIATRPNRPLNIGILIICVFCFWGVGSLIVFSVRDHLS